MFNISRDVGEPDILGRGINAVVLSGHRVTLLLLKIRLLPPVVLGTIHLVDRFLLNILCSGLVEPDGALLLLDELYIAGRFRLGARTKLASSTLDGRIHVLDHGLINVKLQLIIILLGLYF